MASGGRKRKPPAKASPVAPPKKRGGQTSWTPQIEEQLLEWLEDGGTLRAFCRQPGMPSHRAVYRWEEKDPISRPKEEAFAGRFVRAREIRDEVWFEDVHDTARFPIIGETVTLEPVEKKDGTLVYRKRIVREDMLGHRRLLTETLLKLLARRNSKYVERVPMQHSGKIELGFDDLLREALSVPVPKKKGDG